ncbi:unnamed protein product [Closterium sp. NIES-64]|nr:unnamed protein product [Closterium sp. NIES-64]
MEIWLGLAITREARTRKSSDNAEHGGSMRSARPGMHHAHGSPWVAISAKRPGGLWRPANAAMPPAKAASPGARPLAVSLGHLSPPCYPPASWKAPPSLPSPPPSALHLPHRSCLLPALTLAFPLNFPLLTFHFRIHKLHPAAPNRTPRAGGVDLWYSHRPFHLPPVFLPCSIPWTPSCPLALLLPPFLPQTAPPSRPIFPPLAFFIPTFSFSPLPPFRRANVIQAACSTCHQCSVSCTMDASTSPPTVFPSLPPFPFRRTYGTWNVHLTCDLPPVFSLCTMDACFSFFSPTFLLSPLLQTNLWYSERPFHLPPVFPLCTMDACFNFSRCPSPPAREPLVYSYWPGPKYFARFNTTSRWHTDDPSKACFFFVFMSAGHPRHFKDLPFWGEDGHNHVLISFADNWSGPPAWSVGKAALMLTAAHLTVHRAAFDVSLPLPPTWKRHAAGLRSVPVGARRYLLTFMGTRYLGSMHGSFRSSQAFKALHNGKDIIVVTQCGGSTNRRIIEEDPSLLPECTADAALFRSFSYPALMNSSFALVPAGRQASTYRFIEALTAGAIPVVVADNWKLPFDDIIPWHRCLLLFPTHLLSRIEPTLRAITPQAAEKRRQRCVSIFEEYLASDDILMRSAMTALKSHAGGIFPL